MLRNRQNSARLHRAGATMHYERDPLAIDVAARDAANFMQFLQDSGKLVPALCLVPPAWKFFYVLDVEDFVDHPAVRSSAYSSFLSPPPLRLELFETILVLAC